MVCVTGASGFIASWLMNLLLQRGYTVKATVRDPNDPKAERLRELDDGAKERLHIFEANLLEEGSFDSAFDGCDGLFHTASPVLFSRDDLQADIIDPALKGTLNVLTSCAKVPSIKRVVVTSSMAGVIENGTPLTMDVVIDETWFSDPYFRKESKDWYALSKTLAEEAAWRFAEENGIDLVSINLGVVTGPLLQPVLNVGAGLILNLIKGTETITGLRSRFVDVRDVAYVHIRALELPTASGRYVMIGKATQHCDLMEFLREHYPTPLLPGKFEDDKYEPAREVSEERAKSLGINIMPWEASLRHTVESSKEMGFLNV